ncbi:MAG: glucose-6-phosphate isomerase, partial [Nitrospiraceae bacterium]
MLGKVNPLKTASWKKLQRHYDGIKGVHMRDMFRRDPQRFARFSLSFENILVDYSKNIITEETMGLLFDLAGEAGLRDAMERLFSGDRINETENRAVLHTALRNRSNTP